MKIRPATPDDVAVMIEIYNEAVAQTTATYDEQPRSLEQGLAYLETHQQAGYPVLVSENDQGDLTGWGALSCFNPKPGYRFTAENTLYIRTPHRGQGHGRQLLQALIKAARQINLNVILALIDADNEISLRLHEKAGFTRVGHLKKVGFKFERWLDVVYLQYMVNPASSTDH